MDARTPPLFRDRAGDTMRVEITENPLQPNVRIARLANGRADFGALASFVGQCRGESGAVLRLELLHYPGFTETQISAFAARVADRRNVLASLVAHRVGFVAAGEPIVLVAAIATHRAAAFSAVEEIMDYLKTDAPFWKREYGTGDPRWVEPTDEDRRRRAAWGRS